MSGGVVHVGMCVLSLNCWSKHVFVQQVGGVAQPLFQARALPLEELADALVAMYGSLLAEGLPQLSSVCVCVCVLDTSTSLSDFGLCDTSTCLAAGASTT